MALAIISISLGEPVVISPSFSVETNTNLVTVPKGMANSKTVITFFPSEDFNSTITLTANPLPGATGTFSPNVLTGGAVSSPMTVKPDDTARTGSCLLRVKASDGGIERALTLMLVVTEPLPLSVNPFAAALETALAKLSVIGQDVIIPGVMLTPFGLSTDSIYHIHRNRHRSG